VKIAEDTDGVLKIVCKVMVLTSPEHAAHGFRKLVSPSKTLPMGIGNFSKTSDIYQVGQWGSPVKTNQTKGPGDEPMFSRNIPTGFNIVSCPSDKDDITFSNRYKEENKILPVAVIQNPCKL